MRILFLLVFLSGAIAARAGDGIQGASGTNRALFMAGFTNFRPYALNDRFGLTGMNEFTQLTTFGVGGTGTMATQRAGLSDGEFSVMFYDLLTVKSPIDSSVLKAYGWELMTSLYGYDVLKSVKAVDLVIGPGIYWGSVRLAREVQIAPNVKMRYTNPFIAPMLRLDLRFNFWRFSIGGRISYRYDITRSKWKERDGDLIDLPGYRFREGQYVAYIGFRFMKPGTHAASDPLQDSTDFD
jgi:hypothetical protein